MPNRFLNEQMTGHYQRRNFIPSLMEDCYYFLYSSCTKKKCIFRHSEAAKKNLILCKKWAQKNNCQLDCPFRHSDYHLKKDRKEIFCYWEEMEQGCQREFCNFKHKNPSKDEWKQIKIKKLDDIRKPNVSCPHNMTDEQTNTPPQEIENLNESTISKDLQKELDLIDRLLEEEGISFSKDVYKK